MKKINLSFKDVEENIYSYIKKQMNYSVYIKQLVLKDMQEAGEEIDFKKPIIKKEIQKVKAEENNIEF